MQNDIQKGKQAAIISYILIVGVLKIGRASCRERV